MTQNMLAVNTVVWPTWWVNNKLIGRGKIGQFVARDLQR